MSKHNRCRNNTEIHEQRPYKLASRLSSCHPPFFDSKISEISNSDSEPYEKNTVTSSLHPPSVPLPPSGTEKERRKNSAMATCQACEEYDYDVACAERSLMLHDTPREQAHHRDRHRGTETSMAIRRDQSAGLVRQGSVHHSYECRGRDLCYVSSRREGDYLSMADTVRRYPPPLKKKERKEKERKRHLYKSLIL